MNPKAQMCIFNVNRSSYAIAQPWCIYLNQLKIPLPPRIALNFATSKEDCSKCKCYQRAEY